MSDAETLRDYALEDSESACPGITSEEAEDIITASKQVAAEPRLSDALGKLAAFLVRQVAIHELRHAADTPSIFKRSLCPSCPKDLDPATQSELSAYLASFAAPNPLRIN